MAEPQKKLTLPQKLILGALNAPNYPQALVEPPLVSSHAQLPSPVPSHAQQLPSTAPAHRYTGPTIGPPVGGGEMLPSYGQIATSSNPAVGVGRHALNAMEELYQMPEGDIHGEHYEAVGGMPLAPGDMTGVTRVLTRLAKGKGAVPAANAITEAARAGRGAREATAAYDAARVAEADARVADVRSMVTGKVTPTTPEVARSLFPKLDSYGKPTGRLTEATIMKRLEASPHISPKAKRELARLAKQVGDRRIAAEELHALSAGEAYQPDRVLRKVKAPVKGGKQIPGAPLGITSTRQERGLRENYLKRMEEGVEGRDWYRDAGGAIRFYANDDPTRAMQFAEDLSITSPVTAVSGNTGMGVKAYNQATAGVEINAGRFPGPMGKRIAAVHAGGQGATGRKQDPFAHNMARAGGFLRRDIAPRAVHDIWQGEAMGFVNPDGTPMRKGFTEAQHRWMDEQTEKILAEANKRGLGGYTDWDVQRAQAAAWVAAKVRAGEIRPEDAARSYASFFGDLAAQGSRELVPGRTTGHMPEMHRPGMDPYLQRLHEMVTNESGMYDAQGRDQIAAGYGGLVGRSFEGPGFFQGQPAPGMQTQVLTGSMQAPGGPPNARVLDEGSRRILDAAEATHGLLNAQDASAYSRILPAGSGAPRTGWDITLPGGTVTPDQMRALAMRLGPGVSDMVLIPTPDGIRLAFMDEATMKKIVGTSGGKVKTAGTFQSNFIPNDWRVQKVGQGYMDAIRPMGPDKFNAFVPELAQRRRAIDARFAKETRGRFTLSPVMDEVRAVIASEGWAGLERLAKKYAIPVTLLVASLGELGESVPQEPTAETAP